MTRPPAEAPRHAWHVLRGPVTPPQILSVAEDVAARHNLTIHHNSDDAIHLVATDMASPAVSVLWKPLPPQPPHTVGYQLTPPDQREILIQSGPSCTPDAAHELSQRLDTLRLPYTDTEIESITTAMPLLAHYSSAEPAFSDWALLFRDHYLEHSVGFVLAMESAGIPAEWIYALAKGDRTYNRERIHATFLARGYQSGLLDNSAINTPHAHSTKLAEATADIDAFIDTAHAAGRKVLVVDDGGLLAHGYGATNAERRVDAAIELTVSGIKRIAQAGPLGIPVLNMARSRTKTLLGYPEIADSCLRRLRTLIGDRKFIGRQVLLIGYGTLGCRLAPALRSLGCRVDVVDTDLPTLIAAAEAGYPTHRSTAAALQTTAPFLVIGTTGEQALTEDELCLLPDGVLLAPFATRDFSILAETRRPVSDIPGIGCHIHLAGDHTAVLLGDGRSMNLFEADSIPNQGYDAYRASALIAAKHLCANTDRVPPGLHHDPADAAIEAAGLFDAYYDRYLAHPTHRSQAAGMTTRQRRQITACVVGYGNAGRLHTRILNELGADITVIDPKHQDLPKDHRSFPHDVANLPTTRAAEVDLWSICCPTADHMPVLRAVLNHNPTARVLLEKPACQGNEIEEFTGLLAAYPLARVLVNDQYQHSTVLPAFTDLIAEFESQAPITHAAITFTKDRTADIANGRFIDRTYGVLGYEWLHMLAVLSRVLPTPLADAYFASTPEQAELWATYDPRLFVAALTERTTLNHPSGNHTRLELASSILGPSILLGTAPQPRPPWRREIRTADDRHRNVRLEAGTTRFTLHLEPVTAPGGWQLERNHHRLTAERDTNLIYDEVLEDSPLSTAIRYAIATLLDEAPFPEANLAPLHRIAALAETLRARAPGRMSTAGTRASPPTHTDVPGFCNALSSGSG
ncbi:Gfo/Idh/MocA family oxidoreductase [Lipingzhangella sp. LS1_29]|uniref:Gfo/Idh/MocA family oxidoreductase n=1 Tax=Lipingzhangella rawalii TaxID=2055835 RepID=A0ABU2HAD8_9ACTN|nr:Gfo/Idh/MocA family oxidoreductase [Lipingzhangella rawalii]MDS1271805.1 Gfo/Idh/MocA family oxidoreductase [Lipingzhangella rawalii]